MSRIERKYCFSTSYLAGLFDTDFILFDRIVWIVVTIFTDEDTLWCLS